jgi:sec-independent protein translocase protein TatA
MSTPILLGMFGMPGHLEMLIIAGIALLLFGHRLPSVMRSLGRGVVEFKKGVQGIEEEIDSATSADDTQKSDGDIAKPISEK